MNTLGTGFWRDGLGSQAPVPSRHRPRFPSVDPTRPIAAGVLSVQQQGGVSAREREELIMLAAR
jgi:hypothetical protein